MSYFSLQKSSQPHQKDKDRMIKLIKNKLTPLSENQKYPMGKNSFLNFKNLQKMPKLKKQHFSLKNRLAHNEEQIMNHFIEKQLDKSDKNVSEKLYQRPETWLKLWKKTGDNFQNSYFTNRDRTQHSMKYPDQTRYPQDSQAKFRHKILQQNNLSKSTMALLKKVQIYKRTKNEEIQNRKISQNLDNLEKNSDHFDKKLSLVQLFNNLAGGKHDQKPDTPNQQAGRKKNNEWVYFITQFIFNQHVSKTQEDKLFQRFTARKDQNKLSHFVKLFQDNKNGFSSCHLERNINVGSFPHTNRQQKRLNDLKSVNKVKNSQYEDKQNEVLSFNNPSIKLKRLKSILKGIPSDPTDVEQKTNSSSYISSKMRITSNHKKMVQISKMLIKA